MPNLKLRCGLLRRSPTNIMSPRRLQWLELLEREGPSEWPQMIDRGTRTCFACKELGWTRLLRGVDGLVVVGEGLGLVYELTHEGHAALKAHREGRPLPDA
jgi:hypothetical protein